MRSNPCIIHRGKSSRICPGIPIQEEYYKMERKWWHKKVAYQIYPKSFCDSNGDGIGDLRGIISKLDYLKELGVDIIWLSPIYCSPLADQGYDISDYYNIDPRFGTMEDMEELLAEAKKRDMHILMDLVVNHCSDEHEWFKKACEDPDGKYGKYFYIKDYKDGKLPCNWRSYFGGPVWEDRHNLMAYYRKSSEKTLLVIGNYQTEPQSVTLPQALKKVVLNNLPTLVEDGKTLTLAGYQAVVLEV